MAIEQDRESGTEMTSLEQQVWAATFAVQRAAGALTGDVVHEANDAVRMLRAKRKKDPSIGESV